ncbi:SNARE-associated protein Snapin isoform X1 [Passer montanus]|uniref:SNARE-associated protein Snapin isoform X1 n=1 Tax=Passer montanus TaxID=9160 RepID=UPI001960B409|nr:SNARE-associated protein Snapin isoform X1 [Passer montanus]
MLSSAVVPPDAPPDAFPDVLAAALPAARKSLGTTFPISPRGAHRKRSRPLPADSVSQQPPRRPWPRWRRGAAPGRGSSLLRGSCSSCGPPCDSSTATSTASGFYLSPLPRESQVELREHIDSLATELCRINEDQKVALDLDPYVKKLLNARRRVVLVNNILQNAQERLRRLNHSVAKETVRRRAMLEAGGYQGK